MSSDKFVVLVEYKLVTLRWNRIYSYMVRCKNMALNIGESLMYLSWLGDHVKLSVPLIPGDQSPGI